MKYEDLGYNSFFEKHRKERGLDVFEKARVIAQHKDRYIVKTDISEFEGEIVGHLRFTAKSRSHFPAVGDWVAISEYDDNKALIHAVFPRKTTLERQVVGKFAEKQIIATNIDFALIVQAVDRDFSINRIERYLTICNTAKVQPIIILNKTDLITDSQEADLLQGINEKIKQVPIVAISNETQKGYNELLKHISKGKTYCLLGSSGVGKSTLLNNISGEQLMKTNSISFSTNRGKHVTTHRELIVLENGAILIDNPGMREVGIADAAAGLDITFDIIIQLSKNCKFKDCTHTHEIGCAIIAAVENGDIDEESYNNYLKIEKEKSHFETTQFDKRQKDKSFGKMIKNMKKIKKDKF